MKFQDLPKVTKPVLNKPGTGTQVSVSYRISCLPSTGHLPYPSRKKSTSKLIQAASQKGRAGPDLGENFQAPNSYGLKNTGDWAEHRAFLPG